MIRRASTVRALSGAAVCGVLGAGLLSACAGAPAGQAQTESNGSRYVAGNGAAQIIEVSERKAAPPVEGATLEGGRLRLADLKGKVVVINFWASWCAPCRAEAPALQKIYGENKAQGVEFIGVDMREASENAGRAFVRTYKIEYPNLFDKDGRVTLGFREIPPSAVPSTLIIDRQGRVAVRIIGATTYSKLTPLVTRLAAEK